MVTRAPRLLFDDQFCECELTVGEEDLPTGGLHAFWLTSFIRIIHQGRRIFLQICMKDDESIWLIDEEA